ncbi:MAG: restriction endonuclease [Hydrogenophaga sp.]
MPKQGRAYEEAVASIFCKLFPDSDVSRSVWVEGPDGRRELDIQVRVRDKIHSQFGLIECKDFDPQKTGPVGISYIDALDSKRRDLNATFAMICSNSGFTKDAINKAR